MRIQYNGKSKILIRLAELVNQKADAEDLEQTAADLQKEIDEKADKSAIPTVGDGVLSVQRNGKSVGTFSANAAKDTAVNIPVPEKVSELENDAGYGTYTKPAAGIPKSDLASGVQASLDKADTALQKHQDISGKLDKTGDASSTTVAFSAASARENVRTGEKLSVIVGKIAKWFADLKTVAFTGSYDDLANKPTIPDGSKYLPLAGGEMTGDIDMAANGADLLVGTQRSVRHGTLGTAIAGGAVDAKTSFADGLKARKSIVGTYTLANGTWVNLISVRHRNGYGDGINYGMYIYSLLTSGGNLIWNKQTAANTWQGERVLLDSANYTSYASDKNHTHPQITNSIMNLGSAGGAVKWIRLGTIVSAEDGKTMVIRVWSGDGFNARTDQNSSFEIHIKDSWQSTQSATNACAVTVYRINCPSTVTVKVIPTDAVTYTVWIHPSPWTYWNGNYSVYGYYRTWTRQYLTQDAEPTGTGAAIAYYDQAFLTSTVAAAKTLTDSGWVAMTLGTYAASGAVQYRTYGKQITITGRIVLKTEIKTTPKAPQAIANTTLDFSKIKGCSGFGRSSTGIGICVQAEQYSDDNIVDVFSIGSNIAAGATLYFTITGFID